MKKIFYILLIFSIVTSLIGCKSAFEIKNADENAPTPMLKKNQHFIIYENTYDERYGRQPDYPINVFFRNTSNDTINIVRYLNGLAGPQQQKLKYKRVDSCCPFSAPKSEIGAGFIEIYEVTWDGNSTPILLHFNIYHKGKMYIPTGFTAIKD